MKEINTIIEKLKEKQTKITSIKELMDLKTEYLGKKGPIVELTNKIKEAPVEQKKELGILINKVKQEVTNLIEQQKEKIETKELNKKLNSEKVDITLPSTPITEGLTHPITKIIDEVSELFISMGYDVVEGPEVETDLYNFERLNLPTNHPARDAQDTFYINDEYLLRTHTSPVQARYLEQNETKGPVRIICPGKVYRRDDDDATHSHQFTQIEGLLVDKNISLADLKGTLEVVVKKMFGNDRLIRLRPNYFPFTEPSLEVDVSCFKCNQKGCNICKQSGWIEILGSGLVHPNVLSAAGYDPEIYTGFAFGMGVERIAMLKYGVTDIRQFYTNDMRFLENWNRIEGDK